MKVKADDFNRFNTELQYFRDKINKKVNKFYPLLEVAKINLRNNDLEITKEPTPIKSVLSMLNNYCEFNKRV